MNPSPSFVQETQYSFNGLYFETFQHHSEKWMPFHTHRQAHFVLVLSGAVQDTRRHQTFLREPTSLTYLPSEEPHATLCHEGCSTFQIVMEPEWLERREHIGLLTELPTDSQDGPPIWTATRLYHEYQQRDSMTPLMLEGMLIELMAVMTRHSFRLTENESPRWLKQAKDFLHAHFTEPVTIEEIAAAVNVHPSHLMRGFRQHYHCTIGDYVRKLRIEYGCHLLSASDAFPSQIALSLGFSDQSHFNRTFKAFTGMTPLAYRKCMQVQVRDKK